MPTDVRTNPSFVIREAAQPLSGIGKPRRPPRLSDPGSPLRSGRDDDGEVGARRNDGEAGSGDGRLDGNRIGGAF